MRYQPVNLRLIHVIGRKRFFGDFAQHAHRKFEYRIAFHLQQRTPTDLAAVHTARDGKNVCMTAISVQVRRQNTRRVTAFQYHRTCAIAEQNTGGTIFPIENA